MGYGGGVKIEGRTKFKNPIIIKAGTGGTGIKIAYDKIKGKGAYDKMRSDVLETCVSWFKKISIDDIQGILKKYGGNIKLAGDILYFSKVGNTLAYAIQEHIAAHKIREAGYDGVISYSKHQGKPRLSEVFDVRAIEYPTEQTDFSYKDFYNQFKRSKK